MKVKAENGLVGILKEEGTEWVSTFPTSVFNNTVGEEDGIENLMLRDERYAVAVADGFSRVSNGKRFGVCSIMGSLNAAGLQMAYGALAQAYEDGTPLLCLTDGVPPNIKGQERFDISEAFKTVTKWVGYINMGERVPEYMRRAYTYLKNGRPSPVLLQLPRGLGEYDIEDFPYHTVKKWRMGGDEKDVIKAFNALQNAVKPVILAGQGIFYADACLELLEFAEITQIPVITTLKGKSCFPEDHQLSLGMRGVPVEYYLGTSDLIFTIGYGFNPSHFAHTIPEPNKKKIIQCTIDPLEINLSYWIDHAIIGDAKIVLKQLIEESKKQDKTVRDSSIMAKINDLKQGRKEKYAPLMTSDDVPINPYRVYGELMEGLDPSNSFVTHESGNTRDQLSTVYEAKVPHGFLGWGNVSTLGFGLGAAIGAKLAYPDRQIISVTGDAGAGYQMGNWEVLVRCKIGITIIHINNNGFAGYGPGFWGNGHSPWTSDVLNHRIQSTADVAEAIGFKAERLEDPDEIAPAIKNALKENKSEKPYFLEVICAQYPIYGQMVRG
jgi:acetolactate synthase-1/2/3 large subunit